MTRLIRFVIFYVFFINLPQIWSKEVDLLLYLNLKSQNYKKQKIEMLTKNLNKIYSFSTQNWKMNFIFLTITLH
jgi:hypothetical protein